MMTMINQDGINTIEERVLNGEADVNDLKFVISSVGLFSTVTVARATQDLYIADKSVIDTAANNLLNEGGDYLDGVFMPLIINSRDLEDATTEELNVLKKFLNRMQVHSNELYTRMDEHKESYEMED